MAVNIKISELDYFPTASYAIAGEDFLPLVNSSSMTTYKATVASVGATVVPAMQVSWSKYSLSASFASRSISASHADYADLAGNVNTYGAQYYFPFWATNYTPGSNGALMQSSHLYETQSYDPYKGGARIIVIDPGSAFYGGNTPSPISRPDYSTFGWWNYKQNYFGGIPRYGVSGLYTPWPIISATGAMTDQMYWRFMTGSYPLDIVTWPQDTPLTASSYIQTYYWSGSTNPAITPINGLKEIGHDPNAIANKFNGRWIRLVCSSIFGCGNEPDSLASPNCKIASGSAYGEPASSWEGFFGRVRLTLGTDNITGTNSNQVIDMHIHDGIWGGGISAQVFHANFYGYDHIRKLRLSIWTPRSSVTTEKLFNDPMFALDIFVDKLTAGDKQFWIQAYSWGGVRFLQQPNIDPPPLYDTGSSQYAPFDTTGYFDPKTATYLIFPPVPGYYSNVGDNQYGAQGSALQPYMFLGKKIYMDPNRNVVTESAWWVEPTKNYNAYSLKVSGSISTQRYWAEDDGGQGGQLITFDPVTSDWKQWTAKGGILTLSGSATVTPDNLAPKDTVAVGTIMAYGGAIAPQNWLECDGQVRDTASYWELHQAILNQAASATFGYTCDSGGTRNLSGLYFKMPDLRGEFIRGWDHGRGVDAGRTFGSSQTDDVKPHLHSLSLQGCGTNGINYLYYHDGNGVNPSVLTANTTLNAGVESRPKNIATMYIIKYTGAINLATAGTTLAGDCVGNVSATSVQKIRGVTVDTTVPTNGQVLTYDSGLAKWTPQTPAAPPTPTATVDGKSYMLTDPAGFFPSLAGDPIYVLNYNPSAGMTNVSQITMATNAVKPCITASLRDQPGTYYVYQAPGRLFNVKNVPAVTGSVYRSFAWSGNQGCFEFIPNVGSLVDSYGKTIPGTPASYGLTVVSCSYNASWGSQPQLYTLYGDINMGDLYPNLMFIKYTWNGVSSYLQSNSTTTNFRNVTNGNEFLRFMTDYGATYRVGSGNGIWLFDYNYVKKRFYLMVQGCGFLHTFLWTGPGDPFNTSGAPATWPWATPTNITYETSMAIPSVDMSAFVADHPRMIVDYHPDTGVERGLVYWCRNWQQVLGNINYVYWPMTLP